MPKASPWNRNVRHFRLALALTPGQRRQAVIFAGAFVGLAVLSQLPWVDAAAQLLSRRAELARLSKEIYDARLTPISYDAVRTAPPETYLGRPVLWCVDHVAGGVSYLGGKPSQPLSWTNEAAVPKNSPTSGGRCTQVLASIQGWDRDGVKLAFMGEP